ncbi:MAG: acyl-CoA thioesterase [Planctomycetes bacterium]|nr:acyl-CoA thioesterase [Planctomycetota bacterium]
MRGHPFVARVPVRFGDIDRAGIVYYPRVLHYLHVAFEEFFARSVGIPYHRVIDRLRVGFPTVHLEADFLGPLHHGDSLRISLAVAAIGRTSVRFEYVIRRPGARTPAVRASLTAVSVDMRRFRPVPVPSALRRAFARHAPRGRSSV